MIFAFIGTRSPSPRQVIIAKRVAHCLAVSGHSISTGNAPGIDSIGRDVVSEVDPTRVHLKLPWPSFESQGIKHGNQVESYDKWNPRYQKWTDSVDMLHPNPRALKASVRCLHARNYGIIEASNVVIELPRESDQGGGPAQGDRVAHYLGKPVYNLNFDQALELFICTFIGSSLWKSIYSMYA